MRKGSAEEVQKMAKSKKWKKEGNIPYWMPALCQALSHMLFIQSCVIATVDSSCLFFFTDETTDSERICNQSHAIKKCNQDSSSSSTLMSTSTMSVLLGLTGIDHVSTVHETPTWKLEVFNPF